MAATTVALVGRRLPHNENLGLAYLRAALEGAGVSVTTHYVNDAADLARAIGALLAAPPDVVGLSLADGGSALLPLALGEALAVAGYRGHVTAGGQFATLARAWLLERYAWLGSVVRFAGEVPIVALARRVSAGEPVTDVPGVTTRAGDGPPAPVLDLAPMTLRPSRDRLPEILGHPAAHIAASRGCVGRCQYCGPAALHALERREGVRAGIATHTLHEAGVGGVRRRDVDSICDEMAHLFHDRAVRYFYFVDEHMLPCDEGDALRFLSTWAEGLRARGVGPVGIGAMFRVDRLTPALVRALAGLGLVRAFVSLEIATDHEGRSVGRLAPRARDLALLGALADAGVTTVSNLMLVNPYSTPATIAAGIELLERVPAGVFEATRMMVYHGTRLHQRMAEQGRLIGNPLRYGYTFADPTTERFAEIFSRLRGEAFWNYSVAYRTHDSYLALALARRLHPDRVQPQVVSKLDAVRGRVNRLYLDGYRRALALSRSGGGFVEAGGLVRELRGAALALERELERVEAQILAVAPPRARMFAPMNAAAASVVSFTLAACTPACGGRSDLAVTTGHETSVDAGRDANQDAGPDARQDAGRGADAAPTDAGTDAVVCPSPGVVTAQEIDAALAENATCFSGSVTVGSSPPHRHLPAQRSRGGPEHAAVHHPSRGGGDQGAGGRGGRSADPCVPRQHLGGVGRHLRPGR